MLLYCITLIYNIIIPVEIAHIIGYIPMYYNIMYYNTLYVIRDSS